MSDISPFFRRLVVLKAKYRCEYCGLVQDGQEAIFHVDHVVPLVLGGLTEPENLALACVSCSLRKGTRVNFTDSVSKVSIPLFNPRTDR